MPRLVSGSNTVRILRILTKDIEGSDLDLLLPIDSIPWVVAFFDGDLTVACVDLCLESGEADKVPLND